jgi:hypothetical protein
MTLSPIHPHPGLEFTVRSLPTALLLIFLNACTSMAQAYDWRHSPEVAKLFAAANLHGTFVLYDAGADQFTGYNRERAERRYIPASTFKIPNSLIGLSVGAVHDVDEVLPYGGQPQRFKEWEQDMGLRTAIRVSNVPVYQELARRIGLERMRANIAKLDYGNGEIGDVVDRFCRADAVSRATGPGSVADAGRGNGASSGNRAVGTRRRLGSVRQDRLGRHLRSGYRLVGRVGDEGRPGL